MFIVGGTFSLGVMGLADVDRSRSCGGDGTDVIKSGRSLMVFGGDGIDDAVKSRRSLMVFGGDGRVDIFSLSSVSVRYFPNNWSDGMVTSLGGGCSFLRVINGDGVLGSIPSRSAKSGMASSKVWVSSLVVGVSQTLLYSTGSGL